MTSDNNRATPSAADQLRSLCAVLWRRRAVVAILLIITPLAAGFAAQRQQVLYEGTSQVLLSRQNLANSLTGTPDATAQQSDPQRLGRTGAAVAMTPSVASRVIEHLGLSHYTPAGLLDKTRVTPDTNTDLLTFSVKDPDPRVASRLATEFASQFIAYRRYLDTAALTTARRGVQEQLRRLDSSTKPSSRLYATLRDKEQQLQTLEILQTSNAALVRRAGPATKVQPNVRRTLALGAAAGLLLGVGLALAWNALDARIRDPEELADLLGLSLLGRVEAPPRALQRADELVMVHSPTDPRAEPFRLLRTSVELALTSVPDARVIGVTSAIESEGKSTTAANLAVAFAAAGRDVVLVDLDLRRPYIGRFFPAPGNATLTAVLLKQTSVDDALHEAKLQADSPNGGRLRTLACGPPPSGPGELVASEAVGAVIAEVRGKADIVIVDLPPMLRVGDALAVSNRLDAVLVVGRVDVLKRTEAREQRRIIDSLPVPVLGLVATGVSSDMRYGAYYGYQSRDVPEG